MTRRVTVEIIVALLAMLWIYAAISKLLDHHVFVLQLGRTPVIKTYAALVSIALPMLELLLSALLLTVRFRQPGLYGSAILLLIFSIYLTAVLNFSKDIPCSCGGIIGKGWNWKAHIVFNLAFASIAILAISLQRDKKQPLQVMV